jgi:hypothetical protein
MEEFLNIEEYIIDPKAAPQIKPVALILFCVWAISETKIILLVSFNFLSEFY